MKYSGSVPWASTSKASDSGVNAAKHWVKHSKESPEIRTAGDYVEKAASFAKDPPPGTLTEYARNGSDKVLYHETSNTLVIHNAENAPFTMYRPDPNIHGYSSNLDFFNNHPF